jgi:hypothetical protein
MRNVEYASLTRIRADGIPHPHRGAPQSELVIPQWVRPELLDLRGQLGDRERELAAHRRRQVDHLDAAALQSDLLQQFLRVFNSPAGVEITFQVMTFAFQSTRHQHAVGAVLERAQDVEHIEFAGAGQLDDLHRRRIFQAHRPGQIGGGVRAVVTAERYDVGFESILAQGSLQSSEVSSQ